MPITAMKPNKAKLAKLTPETDLKGNKLEVGCRVRSFDFPMYNEEKDLILGITTESEAGADGRVSYIEGILQAIGEDSMEGCKRYRISIVEAVYTDGYPGATKIVRSKQHAGVIVHPPLNGTPTTFGWQTFSVFRIVEQPDAASGESPDL